MACSLVAPLLTCLQNSIATCSQAKREHFSPTGPCPSYTANQCFFGPSMSSSTRKGVLVRFVGLRRVVAPLRRGRPSQRKALAQIYRVFRLRREPCSDLPLGQIADVLGAGRQSKGNLS